MNILVNALGIIDSGGVRVFDKFLSVISLGSRPLKPGIETISLSLFSPGQADPNLIFNNSCFL